MLQPLRNIKMEIYVSGRGTLEKNNSVRGNSMFDVFGRVSRNVATPDIIELLTRIIETNVNGSFMPRLYIVYFVIYKHNLREAFGRAKIKREIYRLFLRSKDYR